MERISATDRTRIIQTGFLSALFFGAVSGKISSHLDQSFSSQVFWYRHKLGRFQTEAFRISIFDFSFHNETMKRILVIGCAGSGKSTLSRRLRDLLQIPLIYLDQVWHLPNGSHITCEEFDEKLAAILKTPCWILDGNYRRTLPVHLECCDTVILLDFPTEICLAQAAGRIGHPREDLPWIETECDPEFQDWIRHFKERSLSDILTMLKPFLQSRSVYVLHSHQEMETFVKAVEILSQFALKN